MIQILVAEKQHWAGETTTQVYYFNHIATSKPGDRPEETVVLCNFA